MDTHSLSTLRSLSITSEDRQLLADPYKPLYNPFPSKPVLVHQYVKDKTKSTTLAKSTKDPFSRRNTRPPAFFAAPLLGALLFDNTDSDARDHCAAERTFLSWLRLSIYMAVVSIAILISFHLKHRPSHLERSIALPFGIVFWVLALACMASGLNNYVKTVNRYSRRRALVQSGWGTQVVCF